MSTNTLPRPLGTVKKLSLYLFSTCKIGIMILALPTTEMIKGSNK